MKRYVTDVYPVAGVRWVDQTGITEEDGIMFTTMKTNSAASRSQITNDQHLIKWSNLKQAILDQVINVAIASAAETASEPTFPIFKGVVDKKIRLNSVTQGTGIKLTPSDGYITIAIDGDGGFQLPIYYTFQRDLLPLAEGKIIYNRDTKQLNWCTGVVWKTTNV